MAIAATVFLTLGVLVVGFGLLSLGNILNLPLTREQARHADMTEPGFRRGMGRIMLTGLALMAVGGLFAALASL